MLLLWRVPRWGIPYSITDEKEKAESKEADTPAAKKKKEKRGKKRKSKAKDNEKIRGREYGVFSYSLLLTSYFHNNKGVLL